MDNEYGDENDTNKTENSHKTVMRCQDKKMCCRNTGGYSDEQFRPLNSVYIFITFFVLFIVYCSF